LFLQTMSAAAIEASRDACDTRTPALVSPSVAATPSSTTPTDNDILCGRGKGIRKHPGNEFYNRLLREHCAEYKSAPKGSKVSIVKKILSLVREQKGRFLEKHKNRWVDIGDERATNKTAQAFRDIRVTMEKQEAFRTSPFLTKTKFTEKDAPSSSLSSSTSSGSDRPRRPTFRERLAMLEQEQHTNNSNNSADEDEERAEDGAKEDEISDTETEDSFPLLQSFN